MLGNGPSSTSCPLLVFEKGKLFKTWNWGMIGIINYSKLFDTLKFHDFVSFITRDH